MTMSKDRVQFTIPSRTPSSSEVVCNKVDVSKRPNRA